MKEDCGCCCVLEARQSSFSWLEARDELFNICRKGQTRVSQSVESITTLPYIGVRGRTSVVAWIDMFGHDTICM